MIGTWLNRIATEPAEDALLTGRFVAFSATVLEGPLARAGCLLGLPQRAGCGWLAFTAPSGEEVYHRFNALCMKLHGRPRHEYVAMMRGEYPRFCRRGFSQEPQDLCVHGAARAGVLIRNRILSNRARRVLACVRPTVTPESARA